VIMGRGNPKNSALSWPRVLKILLIVTGLLLITLGYAYIVEPAWIEVTHLQVTAPMGPRIKIAHLSDLHTRRLGRVERHLLDLLAREQPDLIVITGDSIADNGSGHETEPLHKKLYAPLGVYFVNGNWEHWRPAGSSMSAAPVKILNNASAKIRDHLYLVGIDDAVTGHPDLDRALRDVPSESFRIGLFHSPEYFNEVHTEVQLALAGHTHGGQIRLPWIGPLWLPPGSGGFVRGWYRRGNSQLYVSRGIGTSVLPLRFLCRPELVIIELSK